MPTQHSFGFMGSRKGGAKEVAKRVLGVVHRVLVVVHRVLGVPRRLQSWYLFDPLLRVPFVGYGLGFGGGGVPNCCGGASVW